MAADPRLVRFARESRGAPTVAEAMVWADIRKRRLGHKFRRQQPIGPYIADFVCFEKQLIIELDGWTHSFAETYERDLEREQWLRSQGFTVVRFDDSEVMDDRDAVIDAIYTVLISL